jgi:AcrR family transcriptional regulator
MSTTTAEKLSARERLLAAADELFYDEGINTVGIDRVIERAGVAKASLYSTFGSKEELIVAYLEQRHVEREERVTRWMAKYDDPRQKILAIFDSLGEVARKTSFRGCAFVNASAESRPGSRVEEISDRARAWVKGVFVSLAADAGVADPAEVGKQLALIYDGAIISAKMDRTIKPVQTAKRLAELVVDTAPHR